MSRLTLYKKLKTYLVYKASMLDPYSDEWERIAILVYSIDDLVEYALSKPDQVN